MKIGAFIFIIVFLFVCYLNKCLEKNTIKLDKTIVHIKRLFYTLQRIMNYNLTINELELNQNLDKTKIEVNK